MEVLYIFTANKLEIIRFGKEDPIYQAINQQELENVDFWRAVFAEFLAQTLYVFLGCCSARFVRAPDVTSTLRVSIAFGLAMMALYQMVGLVSGGHINPANTVAMTLMRKITIPRCLLYLVAQFVGGLFGGMLTKAMAPTNLTDTVIVPHLGEGVTEIQAFWCEILFTFLLVIVFITCTDKKRARYGHPGLVIGLTVTLCHLVAKGYSGASLNPSRHLGTALPALYLDNLWIYMIGPFFGGVLAAFVYKLILNPLKVLSVDEAILKMEGESKV